MTSKQVRWWVALLGTILLVGAVGVGAAKHGEEHTETEFVFIGGGSWLGVHLSDVNAEKARELKLAGEYGAVVEKVEPESPAAKAGFEEKDVVVGFAGERVRSVAHLKRLVQETPPGRTVKVEVSRNGQARTLDVTTEARHAGIEWRGFRMPAIEVPRIEIPEFDVQVFTPGPRLGISADSVSGQLADYFGVKQGHGVLVREVLAGSAAEKAGLKAGDVIVAVDGAAVGDPDDLRRALRHEREGKEVTLTFVRDRREQSVKVELDEPAPRAPRERATRIAQERRAEALRHWAEQARAQVEAQREQLHRQMEDQRRAIEEQRRSPMEEQHRAIEQLHRQMEQQRRQMHEQRERLRQELEGRQVI